MFSKFQHVNLLERDLAVDVRTILGWILKKYESIREIGLIRLRIGIIGEPLRMRN